MGRKGRKSQREGCKGRRQRRPISRLRFRNDRRQHSPTGTTGQRAARTRRQTGNTAHGHTACLWPNNTTAHAQPRQQASSPATPTRPTPRPLLALAPPPLANRSNRQQTNGEKDQKATTDKDDRGVLQNRGLGKPPAGDGTAERGEREPADRREHTHGETRPKRAAGLPGCCPGAPFAFFPKGGKPAVPAFRPCRVVRFGALPNGACGLAHPPPDRNARPETPPVPPRSAVPIRRVVCAVALLPRLPAL